MGKTKRILSPVLTYHRGDWQDDLESWLCGQTLAMWVKVDRSPGSCIQVEACSRPLKGSYELRLNRFGFRVEIVRSNGKIVKEVVFAPFRDFVYVCIYEGCRYFRVLV